MTSRNLAYGLIDGKGKNHSSKEYDNSAMELLDVDSRSDLNVIKIKRLKCGRRLTADPNFTDQTSSLKPIVFHSTDYEEKGNQLLCTVCGETVRNVGELVSHWRLELERRGGKVERWKTKGISYAEVKPTGKELPKDVCELCSFNRVCRKIRIK